jgi:hypothetical protein
VVVFLQQTQWFCCGFTTQKPGAAYFSLRINGLQIFMCSRKKVLTEVKFTYKLRSSLYVNFYQNRAAQKTQALGQKPTKPPV